MSNRPKRIGIPRRVMIDAAKRALEADGWKGLKRRGGRGASAVFTGEKNNRSHQLSIRTTQDRWIAFSPKPGGVWETLDDVDLVVVATVDVAAGWDGRSLRENPTKIEIYVLPADHVRKHFDAALTARRAAGLKVKNGHGMWVALDLDPSGVTTAKRVGSGILTGIKPIAVYPVEPPSMATAATEQAETIADIINRARQRIAELQNHPVDKVKLELRLEY